MLEESKRQIDHLISLYKDTEISETDKALALADLKQTIFADEGVIQEQLKQIEMERDSFEMRYKDSLETNSKLIDKVGINNDLPNKEEELKAQELLKEEQLKSVFKKYNKDISEHTK